MEPFCRGMTSCFEFIPLFDGLVGHHPYEYNPKRVVISVKFTKKVTMKMLLSATKDLFNIIVE